MNYWPQVHHPNVPSEIEGVCQSLDDLCCACASAENAVHLLFPLSDLASAYGRYDVAYIEPEVYMDAARCRKAVEAETIA
jgi:hypothetical protein